MSGWKCTSNAEFVKWADGFVPFVVATDVPGQFVDPSTGATVSPYMLVHGAQVTALTTLQPAPADSPANAVTPMSVPGDPTVGISYPHVRELPFLRRGY